MTSGGFLSEFLSYVNKKEATSASAELGNRKEGFVSEKKKDTMKPNSTRFKDAKIQKERKLKSRSSGGKIVTGKSRGVSSSSLLIAQRPKRRLIQKNLTETAGLSWREETNLTKALYASLQDKSRSPQDDADDPLTEEFERRSKRNSLSYEGETPQKPINIDESSRDSNSSLSKAKVHAQRKFAQGQSAPNSPSATPVKFHTEVSQHEKANEVPAKIRKKMGSAQKNQRREKTPVESVKPSTENFLTFLCFRGYGTLPDHFGTFETPDKNSDTRPDTPLSYSDSDNGSKPWSTSNTPVKKYKSPRKYQTQRSMSPPPDLSPVKPVAIHPVQQKVTPPPLLPINVLKVRRSNSTRSDNSSNNDSLTNQIQHDKRNALSFKKYERKTRLGTVLEKTNDAKKRIIRKRKVGKDGLDLAKRRKRMKTKTVPDKRVAMIKTIVKNAIHKNIIVPEAIRMRTLRSRTVKGAQNATKERQTRLRQKIKPVNYSVEEAFNSDEDTVSPSRKNFFEAAEFIKASAFNKDNDANTNKEVDNTHTTDVKKIIKKHIISRQAAKSQSETVKPKTSVHLQTANVKQVKKKPSRSIKTKSVQLKSCKNENLSEEEIDFPKLNIAKENPECCTQAEQTSTIEKPNLSKASSPTKPSSSKTVLQSILSSVRSSMPEGSIPALHDGKEVILVPINAVPTTATINNMTFVSNIKPFNVSSPVKKRMVVKSLKSRVEQTEQDLQQAERTKIKKRRERKTELERRRNRINPVARKVEKKMKDVKPVIKKSPVKRKLPEVVTGLCIDKLAPPQKKRGRPSAKIPVTETHRRPYPTTGVPACIVEVPVFRPTSKEFIDPLVYIESIRPEAQEYGMAKIIPPSDWKPEHKISDETKISPKLQYIHKMKDRWGPNVQTVECIRMHLESQGVKFDMPPHIGGVELDLARLYQTINNFGGAQVVIEKKKWPQIANALRISKQALDRHTKLYEAYCKYLLTYDTLSDLDKHSLEKEVEKERRSVIENGKCVAKGKCIPLSQFNKIARNAKLMNFKEKEEPAPEQVEYEYWKTVTEKVTHTCVMSSSINSSAFPAKKTGFYAKHGWNLNNVRNNNKSILKCLGSLPDVTAPKLHCNMVFSTSCWSSDEHQLPYMHYLHSGADTIWYCVPESMSGQFKAVLQKKCPCLLSDGPIWLPKDSLMVSPSVLIDGDIPVCRSVQKSGQFVIVFPGSYSSNVSCGRNTSESIHYATEDWLPSGLQASKILSESGQPERFSVEQLIFGLFKQDKMSPSILATLLSHLQKIVEKEIGLRHQLVQAGLKMFEKMAVTSKESSDKVVPSIKKRRQSNSNSEGVIRCSVSEKICYLSVVVNDGDNQRFCLEQGILHIQKKAKLKNCKLLYRFTEKELLDFVDLVKRQTAERTTTEK